MDHSELEIDIGSISIFVNVPKECHDTLSKDEIIAVQDQVVTQFWQNADAFGVDTETVRIKQVSSEKGCIICTIGLCAMPSMKVIGGVAVAAFGGVAAYPKFCEGLKKMGEQVGHVRFKMKKKKAEKEKRTALYQNNLKPNEAFEEELKKASKEWLKNKK